MDVYINGAGSTPLKFKDWNLKMVAKFWKSLEILSSFFFQAPEVGLQGCMGSKSPPPQKKKASYLELVSVMGVWLMISQYFTQIHSCLPRNNKKREGVKLSNVKSAPFPSSCDSRQDLQPLQGLRVASRGIQNAIEQTWKWQIYGIWTNYFLWRMWSILCSFACFCAKDRSALCWILFGIERSQFCAAGPSRMLSIGFGSSWVPFLCQKTWGLAGLSPSWRVYPSWYNRTLRCFLLKGKEVLTTCLELSRWDSELLEKIIRYILCVIFICFIISSYILFLEETSTKANAIWYYMIIYILYTIYIQFWINTWSWFRVCKQFVCLYRYTFHDVSVLLH